MPVSNLCDPKHGSAAVAAMQSKHPVTLAVPRLLELQTFCMCHSQNMVYGLWSFNRSWGYFRYTVLYRCACVCPWRLAIAEGRLAPANGRNLGRQDRRAAPVCSFVVPKMGPKTGTKNGAAILLEEGKASKMTAPFLGCCIHSPPPLRAVSSGDSGTFRLFS